MTFKAILKQRARKSKQTKAIKRFGVYEVLLQPLMTEKSYKQSSEMQKYSFVVHTDANKNDVKQAVQTVYKVDPVAVNLVSVVKKGRMQRKLVRPAYKKAIVTLKK